MKSHLLLACILLSACHAQQQPEQKSKPMTDVEKAVKRAVDSQDFRFYATQQRRIVYPGLDEQEHSALIKACGHKFMLGTGDVLKSQGQRQARKQQVDFAAAYNQAMLKMCQKR